MSFVCPMNVRLGEVRESARSPYINKKMKYSTVKEVMTSFPHPILPAVEGDPDYQTINATRKFLKANVQAINTHLGGGTLGHLGLTILDVSYSNITPPPADAPTL
jgi:hypothetical protein